LRLGQFFSGLERRHPVIFVSGRDSRDQFALFRHVRNNGHFAGFGWLQGLRAEVKAKPGLARALVGPMAAKTILGENGADFAIKIDFYSVGLRIGSRKGAQAQ